MTVILPSSYNWDDLDDYGYDYSKYYKSEPVTTSPWWKGKFTSRYKSSLGYSSSTLYDSTSSSYVKYKTSYTDPEDRDQVIKLLTAAYKSVREVVVILDFPFEVKVCFSHESFFRYFKSSDRKTRYVYLTTNCLDDKKQSDSRKIDVLCGSGIHEAAHLRYSEVRVFNSFVHTLESYERSQKDLICILMNLLEDERVEDRLLKERPGYVTYLSTKKSWEFEHSHISSEKTFKTIPDIFNMIVRFIRYKDEITEDDIPDTYSKLFIKIGELISPIYNNQTLGIKDVCTLGKNLFQLIEGELNPSESDYKEITNHHYCTPIFSGLDTENTELTSSDFQDTGLVEYYWLRVIERIASGTAELIDKKTLFTKVVSTSEDKFEYDRIKKRVSKYIPSLRRILVSQSKDYDYIIHGCRSGLLDTTKLAEAYQGVPQVYQRLGHVTTSRIAVCILVDESGSMDWNGKDYTARTSAILLNEALSSVPGVELYIYGHSADYIVDPESKDRLRSSGAIDITIYKEPGMKKEDYFGLAQITAKFENRDGDAILNTAKRIRRFTKDHCILFVISDGEPCADRYCGSEAHKHTKQCINKVESTLDMDVIGICIDRVRGVGDMYSKYIDLTKDLSNFAKELGKIIKKSILKTRKTTTS